MKHIKTFELFDFLKRKEVPETLQSSHYWGSMEKNRLEGMGFTYIPRDGDESRSGLMGVFKLGDQDIFVLNKAEGHQPGYESNHYEIMIDGILKKKCSTISDVEKYIVKL